ncbi:MAG: hypothetical protein HQL36_03060 [Alphaproteobacteria bacterium]|nr:hypothetical protein [Alphaproteobacteria bacterium]
MTNNQPEPVMPVSGTAGMFFNDLTVPDLEKATPQEQEPKVLPDPSKPEDSFGATMVKAAQSVVPSIKSGVGGVIQAFGETPVYIPEGHEEEVYREAARLAVERGLVPAEHPGPTHDTIRDVAQKLYGRGPADSIPNQMAGYGKEVYTEAQQELKPLEPNAEAHSPSWYAYHFTRVMGEMAPSVALSMATRNPTIGATQMGQHVYGLQYGESRNVRGRTPEEARTDALYYGATELISERIPLGVLTKEGITFASRFAKAGLAEGAQEALTEAVQIGYELGVFNDETTLGDAVQRIIDAFVLGAGAGSSMAVVVEPVHRYNQSKAQDVEAEAFADAATAGEWNQSPEQAAAQALSPDNAQPQDAPQQRPPEAPTAVDLQNLMDDKRTVDEIRAEDDARVQADAEAQAQAEAEEAMRPVELGPEWMDVPEGAVLPTGAQVEMNQETGVVRARMPKGDGTKAAPVQAETPEDIAQAEAQVDTNPSQAQAEAGNYRKGHLNFKGMDIAIENPRGSTRSGVDRDGKPWSVNMLATYGYIKRSEGADGDHVDVYVGPNTDSDQIFVVDQVNPEDGSFDEHKNILGASSLEEAVAIYDAHFNDGTGPARRGAVTPLSVDEFKAWIDKDNTKKPLAYVNPATNTKNESQAAPTAPIGDESAATPPAVDGVVAAAPDQSGAPATPAVQNETSDANILDNETRTESSGEQELADQGRTGDEPSLSRRTHVIAEGMTKEDIAPDVWPLVKGRRDLATFANSLSDVEYQQLRDVTRNSTNGLRFPQDIGNTLEPERALAEWKRRLGNNGRVTKSVSEVTQTTEDVGAQPQESAPAQETGPQFPERVHFGLGSLQPKPIRTGVSLFRETSVDGLLDLMMANRDSGPVNDIYVASDRDLAIGQGQNKGVMVEFRDGWVAGEERKKPGTAITDGKEYAVNYITPGAVKRVEIAPGSKPQRRLIAVLAKQAGLVRSKLEDGTIIYADQAAQQVSATKSEKTPDMSTKPAEGSPYAPGLFTPQDTGKATPAAVIPKKQAKRYAGHGFVGTASEIFLAERFPELNKAFDGAGGEKVDIPADKMAATVDGLSTGNELVPVAAYDEALTGVEGKTRPVVVLRNDEGFSAIRAENYDFLVNQNGLSLRQGEDGSIGAFDGDELVAVISQVKVAKSVMDHVGKHHATLEADVVTGQKVVDYKKLKRPSGQTTQRNAEPTSLTKDQQEQAKAGFERFANKLKELRTYLSTDEYKAKRKSAEKASDRNWRLHNFFNFHINSKINQTVRKILAEERRYRKERADLEARLERDDAPEIDAVVIKHTENVKKIGDGIGVRFLEYAGANNQTFDTYIEFITDITKDFDINETAPKQVKKAVERAKRLGQRPSDEGTEPISVVWEMPGGKTVSYTFEPSVDPEFIDKFVGRLKRLSIDAKYGNKASAPKKTGVETKKTKTKRSVVAKKDPSTHTGEAMIEDAGEKIGGARKDVWAQRGLDVTDLDGMSGGEESQYVTKAHVWPKPDYAAMVEEGMPAEVAALVKIVRDRLAAKPMKSKDTADGRRAYVSMMGVLRDHLMKARSVEDVKEARNVLKKEAGWDDGRPYWKRQDAEVGDLYFAPFKRGGRSISDSAVVVSYKEKRRAEKLLAEGWPTAKKEGPTKAKGDDKQLPKRPHLDKVKRSGKDIRNGQDVGSENFITDFGFRGVEFGNWVASDERQKSVNLAYDALHDLADILGIDPDTLSLGGTLGLAFGARGSGRALAHYEPGKMVINLTKMSGAGALAHEWGHALDHYFGELDIDNAYSGAPRSVSGWYDKPGQYSSEPQKRYDRQKGHIEVVRLENLRPEVRDAWNGVMAALFERSKTKAEAVRDAELALEKAEAEVARVEGDIEKFKDDESLKHNVDRFNKWLKTWGHPHVQRMQERLAKVSEMDETGDFGKVKTSYYENAMALSGKSGAKGYWARPTEMLARSLESYVFDKLAERGDVSQYLVQGVEETLFESEAFRGNPYPVGMERKAIDAAYDKLFETIKTRPGEKGGVLFSVGLGRGKRAAWGEFPAVAIQNDLGKAKEHQDYAAAKAGDVDAAARLVDDLIHDDKVAKIADAVKGKDPVIVAVHAQEEGGINEIPLAYAHELAGRIGAEVNDDIVQINRVHHTDAGAYHRIAFQPEFDGIVEPGRNYLIVDDTLTMGGTLAGLRGYIESRGGNVILASTLTGYGAAANIAVQPKMLRKLRQKYGNALDTWLKEELGYGIETLTQGEAGHILSAGTLDELGNRIAAARRAAGERQTARQAGQEKSLKPDGNERFSTAQETASQDTLVDAVRDLFAKIAPEGTRLNILDSLVVSHPNLKLSGSATTERTEVSGAYSPIHDLVSVALNRDALTAVRHETMHALKAGGFFTEQEWNVLVKESQRRWMKRYSVRDEEEGIAYAYGDFRGGKRVSGLPLVKRAFKRLTTLLDRLSNLLQGMGFQTAEDVMARIESGEVANRDQAQAGRDGTRFALPTETTAGKGGSAIPDVQSRAGTVKQQAVLDRIMERPEDVPLRDKITTAVSTFKEEIEKRITQHALDQFDSLKRLEKATHGEIQTASQSAYKMARLTQNLHSVMAAVLRHGPLEFKNGAFSIKEGFDGGFEGIFADIANRGELDLWAGYAIANRSERLMAEGRENLLTEDDIKTLKQHPKERQERFDAALKKWAAFNKAMLDMAESTGLISAENRALWENDDYVPFYRVLEEDFTAGPFNKRGIANQRSGIRQLEGGDQKINDLIENMVMNMTHIVDASMKNEAARRVIKDLEDGGMMDGVLEPVRWDMKGVRIDADQAAKALEGIGIKVGSMGASARDSWLNLFTLKPPSDPDVISVMFDGKPRYFRVNDPLLLSSMTSLGSERVHWLMHVLGAPKRWLTVGITSFPGFMLRNLIRDSLHSWVVSGEKFKPGLDSMRGAAKSLREDPELVGIMSSGAGSGGFYRTDPKDVRKLLHASKLESGSRGVILDTPKKAWEMWRRIGQASENANRIALYDAVLRDTGDPAEAAFQAMDIMDFSMRGDAALVRFLIGTVPFLNARMQGLYRLGRGFKENPKIFMLRGGMIAGATMALMALNDDDERYDDLPDWEKDAYYHIFLDNIFPEEVLKAAGIDKLEWHLKLPKPFEIGAVFSTIPERLWRFAKGQDDGKRLIERLGAMVRDTFAVDMPQFAKPIIEQMSNRISFTDSPIIPERMKDLKPEAQYSANTSKFARAIAEGMPDFAPDAMRSPKRIEAAARGYLGTLGSYIMAAGDFAVSPFFDAPEKPARRADQIPEIGSFVREQPYYSTRWITDFYDLKAEIEALDKTFKRYREEGRKDAAADLVRENKTKLQAAKFIRRQGMTMSKINARIRSIENDKSMSPDEKRTKIDEMLVRRNALAKKTVQRLMDHF